MRRILKNGNPIFLIMISFLLLGEVHGQDNGSLSKKWEEAKNQSEQSLKGKLGLFQLSGPINSYNFPFLKEQGGLRLADGYFSKIQYLDESGYPVIFAPHNVNAAITTGVNHLQPGGSLGVNLTGKGLVVGIFDQTRPKRDHPEFGSRLTQVDGSTETLSEHSTHVSGTILAAGVNAAARGMAYEATGWAFNWESDISKMLANAYEPVSKPSGMLISNHSYGVVLGWRQDGANWTWFGNPAISTQEDWRFGFYSAKSQAIDELIYSRPYYSVVWSAGNDRDDRGDGTRPPDGPDDTIGPEGVAKNNITVGAVSQVLNYTGPNSVAVSGFSAWGPTDDGRIKPDLVGMGVNVFSSSINASDQNSYASLSGTSMSAPNVTGSLFLLQQLYSQRNPGKFMLAATLKSLAIHTAKEAGPAPGPDYMYGWGLLDARASAELILNEDGSSNLIRELILDQGSTYEYEIVSDGITPIRATIAWTDPAGTPVGTALDPSNLMLVNDLDLRIFDEDGVEYFPWTLDPALGAAARGVQTTDNFRDNVEQVFIAAPQAKKYTVRITHKGELSFGMQPFSLVFSAGAVDGAAETLYWIGGASGDWSDPSKWSLTANGPAAGKVPNAGTRVVFDGPAGQNKTVNLSGGSTAFSVNVFGDQVLSLDLKSQNLTVSNGFRISNQITEIKNGSIIFDSESTNELLLEFGQTLFENLTLKFTKGNWSVISGAKFDKLEVGTSNVNFNMAELEANQIRLLSGGIVSGDVESMKFSQSLTFDPTSQFKEGLTAKFEGSSGQYANSSPTQISRLEVMSGTLALSTDGLENLAISNGKAVLGSASLDVQELALGPGGTLEFAQVSSFTVLGQITSSATQQTKASISALAAGSTLIFDVYKKLCFDHLNVSNVNKSGQGIINLGTTATIQNATGWLSQPCDEVLFAKFESTYPCVGAAVTFENQSEGAVSSYLWEFGSGITSTLENPIFVFDSPGRYPVKLTISNSLGSTSFTEEIEISSNELSKPVIVINGSQLTSQQPGSSYQWYLNGEAIAGATGRSFVAEGDGSYQVAIFNELCNRISDPVIISALPEPDLGRFGVFVGPVPSEDVITLQISNEYRGPIHYSIIDLAGRVYLTKVAGKNSEEWTEVITLPNPSGLYILKIETNKLIFHKKIIKN
ncbi:S8 family serine peptidase [Algoriphagus litoralis]|uniref:S8 family serine peptidase n=1 Tax=Algoriphagus litoralis TaxID=2202829 RepID=UPI0018E4E556|nr:S8 family serine peptidase [Algoriphagus litoralis]